MIPEFKSHDAKFKESSNLLSLSKVDAIVLYLPVIQARIIETGSTFDDLHRSIFQNVINSAKHHGADRIDILINEWQKNKIL